MTSIERAKAFLSDKAKKTALVILPLAAAAVQAHAGTLNSVTFSFSSGSSFFPSGSAIASPTTLNGMPFPNGLTIWGNTTFTVTGSGGSADGSTCGGVCAGFYADDSGAGVFPVDALPVTYDFTLQDSNGAPMVWSLSAGIFTPDGLPSNGVSGGVASGGGLAEEQGSFNITGLNGEALEGWYVNLQVDFASGWGYSSGDTITLGIPGDTSVDLGPVNSVPEPATGWMLASAGGVFALIRRRLRRR